MFRWLRWGFAITYVVGIALTYAVPLAGFFGVPLLFVAAFGCTIAHPATQKGLDRLAVAVAIGTNLFILSISLWLFWVPRGAYIRPMAWNALVLLVGAACILVVGILVLGVFRRGGRSGWAVLALTLAVVSFLLGPVLMHTTALLRGFKLAD